MRQIKGKEKAMTTQIMKGWLKGRAKCEGCKFDQKGECLRNSEWAFWRDRDKITNASYPQGIDISETLPCYQKRLTEQSGQDSERQEALNELGKIAPTDSYWRS